MSSHCRLCGALFFFFKQKTAYERRISDWSSDVCSSDLIARAGGGIVATMRAVRAADEEALIAESLPRLDALIAEGVTTIEIKSGYGLSLDAEFKMLRAAKALGGRRPVRIATTFLGAHAVPPDTGAEAYEIGRAHV